MAITIKNNVIHWPISRGVDEQLSISLASGWAAYEELIMDLKYSNNLDQSSALRLRIGTGLTVSGNTLTVALSYQQTAQLRAGIIYADIKLKESGKVIAAIPFQIKLSESVTKVA